MKRLFLVIAVALIAVSASAQKIGVIAGVTGGNSSLKDSNIGLFDQYHAGLVANFPVVEGLRLQPELIYKVKGSTLNQIGTSNANVDMTVGFLEFGLEAQAGIGRDLFRVYGLAEPFIGYNINDKLDLKGKDVIDNLSWNKTEYGLAIGAGVEFFELIQASVKYFWNMGSVNVKDDSKKIVDNGDVRNFNGVTLSLAILF